jgi:hypothetical protein
VDGGKRLANQLPLDNRCDREWAAKMKTGRVAGCMTFESGQAAKRDVTRPT